MHIHHSRPIGPAPVLSLRPFNRLLRLDREGLYCVAKGAALVLGFVINSMWGLIIFLALPFCITHFPTILAVIVGWFMVCAVTMMVGLLFSSCVRGLYSLSGGNFVEPEMITGTFAHSLFGGLIILYFTLFHMTKAYHSGDYYFHGGWISQEEEFWLQLFRIPDMGLAFAWPNSVAEYHQVVLGMDVGLLVTERCILLWLAYIVQTIVTAEAVREKQSEKTTESNESQNQDAIQSSERPTTQTVTAV